ncbi:PAS domain S-box protein [Zooshikella harenae]|uniref:PAS domain S-box protein n=1 Tax=Zooshikella harenae TaxID=2827238 RepID=A0ABS5ZG31_9GAMM|nr:PAS domain S-box protein [Zooshikella harenae]MBU2712925.1 PAS domain S-box protein [Zooshikella harenae]
MESSIKTKDMVHLAVEASPNGMILTNKQGHILLVNKTTEALFGYRREELIDQPIDILIPERLKQNHPQLFQNYFKDPKSRPMGLGLNLFGLHKSGKEIPIEIGLNPIKTDDDTYVLAAIVDIRKQKHAEEMMHLAVEASPNGMIMVDDAGMIVLVNSATESMFGYARDELIGQELDKLVPQRFRGRHPVLREEYLKHPKARAMGQGRELFGLHKSGHEFPVEIGLNPIETTHGLLVLASVIDITERHHAEEMVSLAVEASPNGMVMVNSDGAIIMVNTTTETLFGYARSELIRQPIEILVPDRFRKLHPELRTNYLYSPKARAMGHGRDLYGLHKNGTEFPVEIGLTPIKTKSGMSILASIVDITERKAQEGRLRSALHEKDVLLAEVHHRVKNNLQIIDSLLGMQSDQVFDGKALEILTESQNRVRSMALIHQTLYESRDFSSVDIYDVIPNLVDNLCYSYSLDALRINVEMDIINTQLPIDISIPLGLIINELCSNAIKHAFPDNLEGTIQICFKEMGNDQYQLSVTDDGIGIPESFDIEASSSLGLLLIQHLSEQLDGNLVINRAKPTRFELTFSVTV